MGMVPDGEGPHSVKPIKAALAPLRVGFEDDLGVAVGAEVMTGARELGPDFHVVVYFTIVYNDVLGLSIRHWLLTGGGVDDGQPTVAEAEPRGDVQPLTVRTAVANHVGHCLQLIWIDRCLLVPVEDARDAAHDFFSISRIPSAPRST